MSTRLVMLGLLRERPLYGYELKHIIEEHMGDWTNIAFGSIYFALGKLAEEGQIEKVATEKEGKRPSRSVYQITDSGRVEFERLLREVWEDLQRQYFAIDIALAFLDALPVADVRGYLQARVTKLEALLEHVGAHQAEQLTREEVPASASAVFEHSLVHFQAELDWTRGLGQKIEAGEL